jgi:hypothetical protein
MVWRRLDEPFEIRYEGLGELLGYEVEERPRAVVVEVKRGASFCGRPIYRYSYLFKGRKLGGGRALMTHWGFREGPASMGPATLGFGLFFPEVIESAYRRTPVEEREENLWWVIEELKGKQDIADREDRRGGGSIVAPQGGGREQGGRGADTQGARG